MLSHALFLQIIMQKKPQQATNYNNLNLLPQYDAHEYGTNQNTYIFKIYRVSLTNLYLNIYIYITYLCI